MKSSEKKLAILLAAIVMVCSMFMSVPASEMPLGRSARAELEEDSADDVTGQDDPADLPDPGEPTDLPDPGEPTDSKDQGGSGDPVPNGDETPKSTRIASIDPLSNSILNQFFAMGTIGSAADVNLPNTLTGKAVGGNSVEITGVTWNCNDFDKTSAGKYTFKASLPSGWELADGVSLPTITVEIQTVKLEAFGLTVGETFFYNGLKYIVMTVASEGVDGTAAIIGYEGVKPTGALVIPGRAEDDGDGAYNVLAIGDSAFADCDGLTSVTFPETLAAIGELAFSNCANLAALMFEGTTAPSVAVDSFAGIAERGSISYPIGAMGYDDLLTILGDGWGPDGTYKLTVTAGTGGSVSGTANGEYAAGSQISVKAEAADGYAFSHWTVAGVEGLDTESETLSFEMPEGEVSLTANFVRVYKLTVKAGKGGSVSGTKSGEYEAGTKVTVTAKAKSGYEFIGWTVSGISGFDAENEKLSFTMPEKDVTLTAKFEDTTEMPDTGEHD